MGARFLSVLPNRVRRVEWSQNLETPKLGQSAQTAKQLIEMEKQVAR